jgi:hypothetical protein
MEVPRLPRMETGSMMSGEYRRYWKAGFTPVSENLIIVWDKGRFILHIEDTMPRNPLHEWAWGDFTPPITYHNEAVWVYSPGPIPRVLVELD